MHESGTKPATSAIPMTEAFWTWCRVAASSFGGPAGQIAVMHRIIVDEKQWISERQFLHALNYCMLLPGPEAQQLATYIGWLMHRTAGGLMAGTLFILPGSLSILVLSVLYARFEDAALIQALFYGLKPAVIALVIQAVFRIGARVLSNRILIGIAAMTFIAISLFDLSFPAVIALAALIGFAGSRFFPEAFRIEVKASDGDSTESQRATSEAAVDNISARSVWFESVRVCLVCLPLWFGPLVLLCVCLGEDSVFLQEGMFFSQAAFVTFGGAYSVLAYVAQQAVEKYSWLQPAEMLDGLGMAETTPGPLIMVVQFVGFMGAYRNPGPFSPLVAGIIGSAITTWVTFVPSFFWIFLGAPYIERLRGSKQLSSVLTAITAAVVGVILNLSMWFSWHTLFRDVRTWNKFGMHVQVPTLYSMNIASASIAVLACLLTFRWKQGMATTLAVSVATGVIWFLLNP